MRTEHGAVYFYWAWDYYFQRLLEVTLVAIVIWFVFGILWIAAAISLAWALIREPLSFAPIVFIGDASRALDPAVRRARCIDPEAIRCIMLRRRYIRAGSNLHVIAILAELRDASEADVPLGEFSKLAWRRAARTAKSLSDTCDVPLKWNRDEFSPRMRDGITEILRN
ncbi:MAG: hypothetical protein AB7G17_03025 [Phycisphaerales bacterium]